MKAVYLFVIACYIALLLATSMRVTRRSRSSDAYLLASRGLSVPFVSVLIAGTWTGGVSVVGMAQGAYIHGLSALWFQVGIWVAMFITAFLLPRILQGGKTYSILDIVAGLYGARTGQLAGLLQLVFSIWIVTMQIVGGGAILSFLLQGDVSFSAGMCLTALVFTLYNMMGGLVATAYTNLIHIATIIIGILLGGTYAVVSSHGLARMAHSGHYFAPFGDMGAFQALGLTFINLTLGVLAQPVINTASSAASVRAGRIGIVIGNLVTIPIVVMAALCGITAKAMFPNAPSLSALPMLLDLVPPYIGVFLILAMWAPLMSSGSPFLMGATTLAVKGWVGPLLHIRNDRRLLLASRLTTLAIGGVALLLGFFVKEILRETALLAVFLSGVVCIVAFGWTGRRISWGWAFASLLATVAVVFVFFATGFHKVVHPIWPATGLSLALMTTGLFFSKSRKPKEGP